MEAIVLLLCCLSVTWYGVDGHGRLMDPPSRSSMWRMGFNTPKNYEDNQLFCGGFTYQWKTQGGKCGICGDPYGGPRENEAGGKYATGVISRSYEAGATVNVRVDITAHHKGWFEFRLCPLTAGMTEATHDCLDQHLLSLSDGSTRYYLPPNSHPGSFYVPVKIPSEVICDRCVLQWKYHTGNSWGTDPDGRQCTGCGPQEEFYGCADVSVSLPLGNNNGIDNGWYSSSVSNDRTSTVRRNTISELLQSTTTSDNRRPTPTKPNTRTTENLTTGPVPPTMCKATGVYQGQARMDNWCTKTCGEGQCLPEYCTCTTESVPKSTTESNLGEECRAIGVWKGNDNMDKWCKSNCALGNCPSSHCSCSRRVTSTLTSQAVFSVTSSTRENKRTTAYSRSTDTVSSTATLPPVCRQWSSRDVNNELLNHYCQTRCMITPEKCRTEDHCKCTEYYYPSDNSRCRATAAYKNLPLVEEFCQANCVQSKLQGCDEVCDCS